MALETLDVELAQLVEPAVTCLRCGTPYPMHGDNGGPVRVRVGGWASPADAVGLTCPGFRWVPPGEPGSSYSGKPSPAAP